MVARTHVHEFDSSAVTRALLDEDAATLDLWYKGGDRYRYFDVPLEVYRALIGAPSAGEYVNREIKPNYRYEIADRRRRFRPA
jgi:hypothetical protein